MASQEDSAESCKSVRNRPLTSAEKQKNYRERLKESPEKYERFKQSEAKRQRQRKTTQERTEEEIAHQRMKWRERVRKHRLKKKQEALMNERPFHEQFYMSEAIPNGSGMPEVLGDTEEDTRSMTTILDHNSYRNLEYLQANRDSCLDMNLSEMNIGEYVMDAHEECNRDKSGNNSVKLECNTPEGDDKVGNREIELEARTYFPAEHYAHVTSENGFGVGQSQIYDDGSVNNEEELQDQLPTGRTVLSLVEGFCGESPKKRKPLSAAERQRNYIERLKAQPEKWKQHKMRDTLRRKTVQEQYKMSEEVVSQRRKRQYQRTKRQKGRRITKAQTKETGHGDVSPLQGAPSCAGDFSLTGSAEASTATEGILTNVNMSKVKVEQSDLDSYALEMAGNCTNSTADNCVKVNGENTFGVCQSPVPIEEMQGHMIRTPSVIKLVGGSHKQSPKRKPLTPAERQRNYRAKLKAESDKWEDTKSRDAERRKIMRRQNQNSEEAAIQQRRKATERQREYRRRKKALRPAGYPSAENSEAATSTTRFHQLESSSPDVGESYTHAMFAARDLQTEKCGDVTSDIECGVGQTAFYGNGSPTIVEKMQNQLLASPSLSLPVGVSTGRSLKKTPSTAAERQRQYRERLKAQPDRWEQYKARDLERQKRTLELKKQSEAAALQQRKRAREKQREYRRRKREQNSEMKGTGHASMDYLQTNTDSDLNMNPSELEIGQYVIDTHEESEDLWKSECNTLNGGDNATCEVKLEVQDNSPAEHVVDPANENGSGLGQISTCKDKCQSQLLMGPSVASSVKVAPRRQPRRRKAMTAAERQRKYRERMRAESKKEEQVDLRGTETTKNIQDPQKASESTASQIRKKATEGTQLSHFKKRKEVIFNLHGKNVHPYQPTRSTTASRRQQNRTVKTKQLHVSEIVMESEKSVDRISSSTEIHDQEIDAQLAHKRMKGRERMRKYRLKQKQKQKQKLQKVCGESRDSVTPRIVAVWSMSEGSKQGVCLKQENNTRFLASKFDNSGCNVSNVPILPKASTSTMNADDLAKIVPQDDMGQIYQVVPNLFVVNPLGRAKPCSDVPTIFPTQSPQPNDNRDQLWTGASEENAIPFKVKKITSADRQRQYRERLQQNPEKWAAYKQRENERYLAKKAVLTVKEIKKTRKRTLLRMRQRRLKPKEGKNSQYITLYNALDIVQDGISKGEGQASLVSGKSVGSLEAKSTGRRGKRGLNKSPEEIERLRQANRERQRRHRAKKRMEQSMQGSRSFAERMELPVLADCRVTNRVEESEITINKGELCRGQGESQDTVGSEFHCSTQFRIFPNLSPTEHMGPRKQLTARKKRGRPRKQTLVKTEQCTDVAFNDLMASSLGNEGHGEVLVSSAGNIPMIIKMPEVKGEQDHRWEEIPQVIPCDPPEADFDWGNVGLDHFEQGLDGEMSLDQVQVTEPVQGEGEGGCIFGSARRKAFFPTKHDTTDFTLNTSWVAETPLGDP